MNLIHAFILVLVVPGTASLGTTLIEGDVYVQLITSLYSYAHPNGTCTGVDVETVQNIEAVKWSFKQINEKSLFPVKIGLRISTTCGSLKKAEEIAYDLAMELGTNTSDVVGVIGPDYSSQTDVVSRLLGSLPEQSRLPQVTYAATSAFLGDRNMYKNLYRTIPSDDTQVEVMLELMQRLDWTYVAIIYNDDTYGKGGCDALKAGSESPDLCFPVQIAIDDSQRNTPAIKDILTTKIINATVPIGGVIVYGSYELIDKILDAAEDIQANYPDWTRPVFLLSETGTYITDRRSNVSLGAYVMSPPRRVVGEFWSDTRNIFTDHAELYQQLDKQPWLREFYNSIIGCQLADDVSSNTCPSISSEMFDSKVTQSAYNQYAIQAALTLGKVIKDTVNSACGSTFCQAVLQQPRKTFLDTFNNLNVSFDNDFGNLRPAVFKNPDLVFSFNGSVNPNLPAEFPLYEVYNVQKCAGTSDGSCLKKIAELRSDKTLSITSENDIKDYHQNGTEQTWPNVRKPQCPNGHMCPNCGEPSYIYPTLFVPGDLYIVGIVPVHLSGSTPMVCGDIKIGSIDVVESIRFAIEEAKTIYSGTVPGVNIGVIIIDSCNDAQTVQEKILTLHRLGVYYDGAYIPVADKIIGYIAAWSSDTSKAVAAILSRLKYPQISYSSTAPILSKRSIYPYFMRICSPDTEQARVMIQIADALKANVIQIVYSAGAYGEGARDILIELAKDMKICIAQTVEITKTSDQSTLIGSLRKYSYARYVVIFVGSAELTRYIATLSEINKDEFQFIASEAWGTRDIVKGLTNLIGSISVSSELPINDKFIDHMKALKPDGSDANPWIRPYMEKYFDCYYQWSYDKGSGNQCSDHESLDFHLNNYHISAWAPFAEKGVQVLLKGVKQAMDKYCGGVETICAELRDNMQDFVDIVEIQTLKEDNSNKRVLDDNGDGLVGYTIYMVLLDDKGNYRKIGTSEPGAFNLQVGNFRTYRGGKILTSECGEQEACQRCFPTTKTIETIKISDATIGLVVALAVVCCLLVAIIIFIFVKNGCCFERDPNTKRLRYKSMYLTNIYAREPQRHAPDSMYFDKTYDKIPSNRVREENSAGSLATTSSSRDFSNERRNLVPGGERRHVDNDRNFSDGTRNFQSGTRGYRAEDRNFSDGTRNFQSGTRGYRPEDRNFSDGCGRDFKNGGNDHINESRFASDGGRDLSAKWKRHDDPQNLDNIKGRTQGFMNNSFDPISKDDAIREEPDSGESGVQEVPFEMDIHEDKDIEDGKGNTVHLVAPGAVDADGRGSDGYLKCGGVKPKPDSYLELGNV